MSKFYIFIIFFSSYTFYDSGTGKKTWGTQAENNNAYQFERCQDSG